MNRFIAALTMAFLWIQPSGVNCQVQERGKPSEKIAIRGNVVGQNGEPLSGARVYPLCDDHLDVKIKVKRQKPDFKNLEITVLGHEEIERDGERERKTLYDTLRLLELNRTDKQGDFEVMADRLPKAVIVFPPNEPPFSQIVKDASEPLKIRVPQRSSVTVRVDLPEDSGIHAFRIGPSGRSAFPDWLRAYDVILKVPESGVLCTFWADLKNGESVTFPGVDPAEHYYAVHRVDRPGKQEMSTRSETIFFDLKAGEQRSLSFDAKAGSPVSGVISGFEIDESHFAEAWILRPQDSLLIADQWLGGSSSRTLDALFVDDKGEFKFQNIPAGRYRLLVRGYTITMSGDFKAYSLSHIASRDLEIAGIQDALKIELELTAYEPWKRERGVISNLEIVDAKGDGIEGAYVFPVEKGYTKFATRGYSAATNSVGQGLATIQVEPGKHDFFVLDEGRCKIVSLETPLKDTARIELPPYPWWHQLSPEVTAELIKLKLEPTPSAELFKLSITNNRREPITLTRDKVFVEIAFVAVSGDIGTTDYSLLPSDHEWLGQTIAPDKSLELQLNIRKIVEEGGWFDARLGSVASMKPFAPTICVRVTIDGVQSAWQQFKKLARRQW